MTVSSRLPGPRRWWMAAVAAILVLSPGVAGCGDQNGDPASPTTLQPPSPTGYPDPGETVEALLQALAGERWEDAARVTVRGQMALVALAEGADIETVSDYLQLGELAVGVNFWAGFSGVAGEFLAGSLDDLRVVSDRPYQAGGVSFVDFRLASSASPEGRTFKLTVARSDDFLWRVDVIATFVDVLAHRLSETAEIIRATRSEDAAVVATEMMRHVPSLEAVLTDPDLTPESSQAILSALAAFQ